MRIYVRGQRAGNTWQKNSEIILFIQERYRQKRRFVKHIQNRLRMSWEIILKRTDISSFIRIRWRCSKLRKRERMSWSQLQRRVVRRWHFCFRFCRRFLRIRWRERFLFTRRRHWQATSIVPCSRRLSFSVTGRYLPGYTMEIRNRQSVRESDRAQILSWRTRRC